MTSPLQRTLLFVGTQMKLTLKKLLLTAFVVTSILTAAVGGLGLYNMNQINDASRAIYDRELMGLSYIKDAGIHRAAAARDWRTILIAKDEEARKKARAGLEGRFTKLEEAFIQQQIAAAATVRDSAERFTTQLIQAYIAGAGLLLLLIGGLIWAVQRSVCRPLWALRDLLQHVQQNSDLSLRANTKGKDEILKVLKVINIEPTIV